MKHTVAKNGFELVEGILSAPEQHDLIEAIGPVNGAGRRGLLGLPQVSGLANSAQLIELVRTHLPASPIPVRAIYFDKSPDSNWLVTWHQDLTIAVRKRIEVPGFGPWSMKEGITHVQPPIALVQQMLAVRLHLDDCDESNGALRVLRGSHLKGRLSNPQIQELRVQAAEVICSAKAGDALLMRPLLLHSSGRSTNTRHRRVLHIEYAGFKLPGGLAWHEAA